VSGNNGPRLTFVILCLGRTGSTHLVALLDSHPEIRCFGELFPHERGTLDEGYAPYWRSDALEYVAGVTAPVTEGAVGFKLPMGSIQAHPDALRLLEPPDLRVVRLSRLNLLALFVSRRLLASTRDSQSTRGEYGDATVALDPNKCLSMFERTEQHERYLDELAGDKRVFRITYEELAGGERLPEIQRFLGVESMPLKSDHSRARKRSLRETIENWPEVEGALRGSPYERFLQDDLELS
jgi:hypothetical protein